MEQLLLLQETKISEIQERIGSELTIDTGE
jgi:hypothetical protein